MGFFNQLLLLLWKNFTLRKRQKVSYYGFSLTLYLDDKCYCYKDIKLVYKKNVIKQK